MAFHIPHNPSIPVGLCQCGCHQAIKPDNRFIQGHGSRVRPNYRGTTEERFWKRVNKTATCWLWTGGHRDKHGYGYFYYDSHHGHAHRYSYTLHHGRIFDGIEVCHACDTPACVRPDHLFLGSHSDNIADAALKGRLHGRENPLKGSAHPNAKLTEEQVKRIHALKGTLSSNKVSVLFSISRATVKRIWRGLAWRHVR